MSLLGIIMGTQMTELTRLSSVPIHKGNLSALSYKHTEHVLVGYHHGDTDDRVDETVFCAYPQRELVCPVLQTYRACPCWVSSWGHRWQSWRDCLLCQSTKGTCLPCPTNIQSMSLLGIIMGTQMTELTRQELVCPVLQTNTLGNEVHIDTAHSTHVKLEFMRKLLHVSPCRGVHDAYKWVN